MLAWHFYLFIVHIGYETLKTNAILPSLFLLLNSEHWIWLSQMRPAVL